MNRSQLLVGIVVTLFTVLAIVLLTMLPAVANGRMALITTTPSVTPSQQAEYLPVVQYDFTPTPMGTPTVTPYSAAAVLRITAFRPINASTFDNGSFVLENQSLNDERISQVTIDLSTAVFPDVIFDPNGTGGDTVAKDLVVDGTAGMTFAGHSYAGERGGGYDILNLNFANFDPGDSFTFSVDVDPNSIRGVGAPGPNESGSVCGLEMIGATVTVIFEGGQVLTNQVYRMPEPDNACGAWVQLRDGLPGRPLITADHLQVTPIPNYIVQIGGPPGQPVNVLVIEGGLFTQGVPGGGYDLDPFEANSALIDREYTAFIGAGGTTAVQVDLSRSHPNGGLNYIVATFDNYYGVKGLVTEPIVVELSDSP
jgi:hypothetical protein